MELDRDDDGNYQKLIGAAAATDSATRGSFPSTVTALRQARVRDHGLRIVPSLTPSHPTFQMVRLTNAKLE
jgi:hypothetical protein